MESSRLPILLQALIFFIPVDIYVIGDWLGAGIQLPLIRFQQTYLGFSSLSILRDLTLVRTGIITGKSVIAVYLWTLAIFILVVATCLLIIGLLEKNVRLIQGSSFATCISGLIFLVAMIVQYGPLLSSLSGFAIPIGLPYIFYLAWWIHQYPPHLNE